MYFELVEFYYERGEDTNGVIIRRDSKDRHFNGQHKKDKKTNSCLQNTTKKTKD